MQIHGLGGHSADAHQVTECLHQHDVQRKTGGVKAAPQNVVPQKAAEELSDALEGQFSLSAWVQKLFLTKKGLLFRLRGDNHSQVPMDKSHKGEQIGESQVMAQIGKPGDEQNFTANGAKLVNPYFVEADNSAKPMPNVWQKIRFQVQNMAGQLKKQFSGKNSFQTRQEKPKEDLRRHSRYRKDQEEIECILTDDSYLMDSYNRKGEYSRLSARK